MLVVAPDETAAVDIRQQYDDEIATVLVKGCVRSSDASSRDNWCACVYL